MTEDGLAVVTDEGAGIDRPGWHALAPPGELAGSRGSLRQPDPDVAEPSPLPETTPLHGSDEAAGAEAVAFVTLGTNVDEPPAVDSGHVYLAIKIDGAWARTVTDAQGGFEFPPPAENESELRVFDPASSLLAKVVGTTPISGVEADLTSDLELRPSTGPDADSDGLSDEIERAIGSSPTRRPAGTATGTGATTWRRCGWGSILQRGRRRWRAPSRRCS
ncbi:MAG: hypothetical protein AAF763_14320 [Pseudomonadota bacterium]